MSPGKPSDSDGQPLLSEDRSASRSPSVNRDLHRASVSRGLGRHPIASRHRQSNHSRRSAYDLENADSDVAFTIVVKKEGGDEHGASGDLADTLVDVTQDAVNEAVQDAVQDACGQAVQDAVQEAVQEAIQQALEDNVRFDVRANFFTLIAITGVILFWRGIWSMWDKIFGFSIWSELGSIGAGLAIMVTFRLIGVPLLDGLPSG